MSQTLLYLLSSVEFWICFFNLLFIKKIFLLGIVDFIMLYQFQVYGQVNLFSIYINLLFFRFFSHIGHNRVLSRIPCAIQQALINYLFYVYSVVLVSVPVFQFIPSPLYPPVAIAYPGAWQAIVHGVAKSWTRLSDFPFTFHFQP